MALFKNLFKKKDNKAAPVVEKKPIADPKPKTKTNKKSGQLSAQREKQVQRVMEKTGWDHDYTVKKMLAANKSIGCKFSEYNKFRLFEYPEEELDFQYRVCLDHQEAKKQRLENRVIVVMDNTGWDHDKAMSHINMVKDKYSINSEDYVRYELYNAPDDGFMEYYNKKIEEKRADYRAKREECVQKVMKKTGWDHDHAKAMMDDCIKRTHCTPKEFVIYRMYDLTEEEQDKVFLAYHSKQIMAKYDVSKNFITVLRNKELTNEMFADLIKRAWCVNNKVTLDQFKTIFANSTKIIYKPVGGHRGFGVETFELTADTIDDVYAKLSQYPTGVVEEFVKQHPDINKICATSVNTIRIVTISSVHDPVTDDGKMFDIAYVAFRIGGGTSIVDNFHSGGMVAAVDKNTGVILTDAADGDGNVFVTHPMTGTKIKGFQIPYFKEAIDMVTAECQKHKIENYIGWDMAISETGPELIEVNDRPGVVLISTPFAAEKIGMKPEMDRFLTPAKPKKQEIKKAQKKTPAVVDAEFDGRELSQYELKKPDYDLVDREYNPEFDTDCQPARYKKDGDLWVAKDNSGTTARIMFTGDITCFEKQMETSVSDGNYDFNHEFQCIMPVFQQSDLLVGNLETMLYPQAPYRNEKYVAEQNFHCNAPLEFLQAVKNAGFDVLTNANNHDMDTGAVGIGETIKFIEKFGFIQTGTFRENKKRYELLEVNGIKVAIVAFATEHNNKRCNLTDEGASLLLNDYSKARAKATIDQARADGADVVFCCIHWGKENKLRHNNSQEKVATTLANLGYDCIIGSHPHVLQDFDIITAGSKSVPVFYSMGNFVSHNANCAKARTVVACVDVAKENGELTLECSYVPVFTSRSYQDKSFVVIPAKKDSKDSANVKKCRTIADVLGSKIAYAKDVDYPDYIEDACAKPEKMQKTVKPNLAKISQFPLDYVEGKFAYKVYESYAEIEKFADTSTNSYTVPNDVLGLPVTAVQEYAFANTPSIKKINFRKNMTTISAGLCKGCAGLEGIQMPESTQAIGDEAFADCTSLAAVVIKSGTSKIGAKAFAGCTELRTVKFKTDSCDIAPDAFQGCTKAVFYCAQGSSPEQYAKDNGFQVVNMIVE